MLMKIGESYGDAGFAMELVEVGGRPLSSASDCWAPSPPAGSAEPTSFSTQSDSFATLFSSVPMRLRRGVLDLP